MKKKTNVQNKQILILKRKYPPQDLSQFVSRIYHRNNSIKISLRHKKIQPISTIILKFTSKN